MRKIKEISKILAKTDNEKIIEKFLESILTEKEINDISSRWELVKMLDEGVSQRKISEKLGLSLCKITRGSRELKKRDSSFKKMIDGYKEISNGK
ncbi:MAG: trp operon repressor [Spirochaetes bacterium]|jgi:TrpR family trp operon transcriptional repressor|nr:trp operon repressor [Spirochaetota bacterium]